MPDYLTVNPWFIIMRESESRINIPEQMRTSSDMESVSHTLERGLQCESHNLQETIGYWRALCDLGWDEEAERVRAFIDGLFEKEI